MEDSDSRGSSSAGRRADPTEASAAESESDDLFNDNVSVMSDSISITSKILNKCDAKKIASKLQRLKQENISLRDSLEKLNATDVAVLMQKLRGAHADNQKLRQLNAELKDRNQLLEDRVMALLADFSGTVDAKARLAQGMAVRHRPAAGDGSQVESKLDDGPLAVPPVPPSPDDMKALAKKLKHAERLLQSYEVKLRLLQDGNASKLVNEVVDMPQDESGHMESSVTFQDPPATRRRKVYTEEDLNTRLRESREVDKRTIEQLIQEVKRVEAQAAAAATAAVEDEAAAASTATASFNRMSTQALTPVAPAPPTSKPAGEAGTGWPSTLVIIVPALLVVVWVFVQTMLQLLDHARNSRPF